MADNLSIKILNILKIIDKESDRKLTLIDKKRLEQVRKLDLSNLKMESLPSSIEILINLEELHLSSNCLIAVPESIGNLRKLEYLSLANNQLRIIPESIGKLKNLWRLNLSNNKLETIPTSIGNLCNLVFLNLSWNYIKILPDSIGNLSKLQSLQINNNRLERIPNSIGNLKKLFALYLSDNNLTILPDEMVENSSVRSLYLSRNPLIQLPDWLGQMSRIKLLDITEMTLPQLPCSLLDLNLRFNLDKQWSASDGIHIHNLTLIDQPIEMFINNDYALIKDWYRTHALGQIEKVNEAKVIFLGDGEAGKSLAISRLMNNGIIPDDFDGESTPGIETQIKPYNIENEDVLVHYWDFGGQEMLHSMHRMFLTRRTLYVVFVNVRENTQDDRARYWLHNIQSFASGSNVILVLNKMDQNPNATINENALRRLYPNLQDIVCISALRDNVTVFNERLESTIIKNITSMESRKSMFPSAWKKLKTELENMDGNYIDKQTYMDICNRCNVDVSKNVRDELIDWMGDLGVCFCYRVYRSLSEYMILNPKWITNAIYIILFNGKNLASHGVISQEKIYELLQNAKNYKEHKLRSVLNIDYKNFEIGYILGVIRRFRLSYQLDEEHEFLPMLCDNNELPIASDYQNREDIQEFYLEYEYLPLNVLHQFLVDMHSYLNLEQVWLTGAEFRFDSMNMTALILAEESKIKIFIKNHSQVYKAGTVLNLILDVFNRINERMGISAEKTLVYKENGRKDTFDYEEISEAVEYGEVQRYNRIFKKSINLVSLLNHAGAEERFEEKMLIQEVIKSCQEAQDYFPLQSSYEDPKNTYIAKHLRAKSYCAYDQTFGGKSQSGKGPGELDILICSDSDTPLAIYEGLMLNSFLSEDKKSWSEHLKKLVDNYNSRGIQLGFLVSYVNWEKAQFKGLHDEYCEYIKQYSFEECDFELVNISPLSIEGNFTRAMMVHYQFAGMPIRICMICVRFGK